MWSYLPLDILANIFSFLPPDSLARARSACRNWHDCSKVYPSSTSSSLSCEHQDWFVALPSRNRSLCCYVHNPVMDTWHDLSLDFLPHPIRPVASFGSLVLSRPTNSTLLHLALCNPFTRQFRNLPTLNISRTNPAVGVVTLGQDRHGRFPYFRLYVAGGMSDAPGGGATYEPTLEMYDSREDNWRIVSSMPTEFAVRLTVWTPNESVYCNGVLYWMTSARAYTVMGLHISSNRWREFGVPMADKLEFAALALRKGRLTLVGAAEDACVWELNENDMWVLVAKVPTELVIKFSDEKRRWSSTRCVGSNGAVCLYRQLGSGMVVWREIEEKGKWEWLWVEGCRVLRGKNVQNLPIKGVLLHPSLAPSAILNK